MKYLLIMGIALVVYWVWRNNRESEKSGATSGPLRSPQNPALTATEVVACGVCQLHLPRADALISSKGFFCCEAHRRQADGK